jgi:hypothetical protein
MQDPSHENADVDANSPTDADADTDTGADANVDADTDVDTSSTSPAIVGSRLLSRILVTWVELTLVGFGGAALGSATSGPPQLVVFLATTLLSVGVLFYNVDRLVSDRLGA